MGSSGRRGRPGSGRRSRCGRSAARSCDSVQSAYARGLRGTWPEPLVRQQPLVPASYSHELGVFVSVTAYFRMRLMLLCLSSGVGEPLSVAVGEVWVVDDASLDA
ncbi:hypothetical protein ACFPRL_18905 [Pseudoclavibacter helvolus]